LELQKLGPAAAARRAEDVATHVVVVVVVWVLVKAGLFASSLGLCVGSEDRWVQVLGPSACLASPQFVWPVWNALGPSACLLLVSSCALPTQARSSLPLAIAAPTRGAPGPDLRVVSSRVVAVRRPSFSVAVEGCGVGGVVDVGKGGRG
jgi:hypothetical protein